MAILESVLNVILKAIAWVTTSNASQYAYDALTAFANLILKAAGNIGLK
ncbi:MAG: hypothetical protein IJB86_06700 [Clostridia bacterium]|nr:hypothetical protein [Clostridia bacterium]